MSIIRSKSVKEISVKACSALVGGCGGGDADKLKAHEHVAPSISSGASQASVGNIVNTVA